MSHQQEEKKAAGLYLRIMLPAPRQKPPQISPIFISDKVTIHVLREKDKEIALGRCR
jgi:hypothetical protein